MFKNIFYDIKSIKKVILSAFLAMCIGIFTSIVVFLFLTSLKILNTYLLKEHISFLFLPIGLMLNNYIINKFDKDAKGYGTEKVITAIRENKGHIGFKIIPTKILATIITLSFGGSLGKVGPSAQLGGACASFITENFNIKNNKKYLICGISAGFSTILGAPIASSLFAVEVLAMDRIHYNLLFLSAISSISSFKFIQFLGYNYHFNNFYKINDKDFLLLWESIFMGVALGIVGYIFIFSIAFFKNKFSKLKNDLLKGFFGGLMLVFIYLVFKDKYDMTKFFYVGEGEIFKNLSGKNAISFDFLIKILFTSITTACGGSGGLISPILFIGSSFGNLLGQIFNKNTTLFAASGIVSLLAACTNAPIASCVLALELFGKQIGVYSSISCIMSFIIASRISVYMKDFRNTDNISSFKEGDIDKI